MHVTRKRFEALTAQALDEIPARFQALLLNVEISVRGAPGAEAGQWRGSQTLLGLYSGLSRDQMLSTGAGSHLPARVILYQRNIERDCKDEGQLAAAIHTTLRHELAHHFGFSDDDLRKKWPEGASS